MRRRKGQFCAAGIIRLIEDEGWEVLSHEEVGSRTLASATDDDREFIAQACVDGEVLVFHTWSADDDD